jgi:hypothetical protein
LYLWISKWFTYKKATGHPQRDWMVSGQCRNHISNFSSVSSSFCLQKVFDKY